MPLRGHPERFLAIVSVPSQPVVGFGGNLNCPDGSWIVRTDGDAHGSAPLCPSVYVIYLKITTSAPNPASDRSRCSAPLAPAPAGHSGAGRTLAEARGQCPAGTCEVGPSSRPRVRSTRSSKPRCGHLRAESAADVYPGPRRRKRRKWQRNCECQSSKRAIDGLHWLLRPSDVAVTG